MGESSESELRESWANAFVRQSRSDFDVYRHLAEIDDLPRCHALHYLQMTCEKIAKAYRVRDLPTDVHDLMRHHVGFVKFINAFLMSPAITYLYEGKSRQLQRLRSQAKQLAQQIERMAPAVAPQISPANTEYPWYDGQGVIAPCDYTFPDLSLLEESGGRAFLKLLEQALRDFEIVEIQ